MRQTHSAPGRLELVREFVNTRDVEEGTDELSDPAGAARWLRTHELVEPGAAPPSGDDLARLTSVRESLRELLLAGNRGDPPPEAAFDSLNEHSRGVSLELRFAPGGAGLASGCGGVDGALAELLGIVYAAMSDDTWGRLKACPAEDCLWAFYDRSRNRSATWCQMGQCGNRSKARAFRARRRKPEPG